MYVSWKGTPYFKDQLCKNRACDCVTFAYGFYCDLFNFPFSENELPRFSIKQRTNSRITYELMTLFKTKFSLESVESMNVFPGDLIAARTRDNLGHVFIVSTEKNMVYHCDRYAGVICSGFACVNPICRIFRSTKRELWV